jgi:G3E family GTPase
MNGEPAGKTTLINYILSQDHGRKVAIIENEFGEIGIDNDLIVGKEDLQGDELTILENGCLCCTVRDDLVKALNALVERGGFDQVLIETTGTSTCHIPLLAHTFMFAQTCTQHQIQGHCYNVKSSTVIPLGSDPQDF